MVFPCICMYNHHYVSGIAKLGFDLSNRFWVSKFKFLSDDMFMKTLHSASLSYFYYY